MSRSAVFNSDGKGVHVTLAHTVDTMEVAYVEGWLGLMGRSGDSGDTRALVIDDREYQWYVPDGLSVSKGDTVYVDPADITGHSIDDSSYTTTAGAGLIALFKATSDKDASGGSGNHWVQGVSLLKSQGV